MDLLLDIYQTLFPALPTLVAVVVVAGGLWVSHRVMALPIAWPGRESLERVISLRELRTED